MSIRDPDSQRELNAYVKNRLRRRKRRHSKQDIEVTMAYLMASSIRNYAMMRTLSPTVRNILGRMKFRKGSNIINLRFPHHWVLPYHDGFRGGIKRKGIWIFWPRKGGVTLDPRRPALAFQEKKRSQVISMKKKLATASKAERKKWKQMVRDTGGIITTRRKGWKGDPFLDKAVKSFWAQAENDLKPYLGKIFDLELAIMTRKVFGAFGLSVSGRGPKVTTSKKAIAGSPLGMSMELYSEFESEFKAIAEASVDLMKKARRG